jgi:hypothetical protein
LNVLSASPPSLWNNFNWGEQNWGQDEDLWTDTNKGIFETLNIEDVLHKSVTLTITNTLTLTENLESITKSIGNWNYVFTKPTTEGDEKVFDESSKVADSDTSWSDVSEASSTWSDV